jgi:hypothetical protein
MERIAARTDRSGGPEACWPCGGTHNQGGYARIYLGGRGSRLALVPRLVLAQKLGREILPRHLACHTCDNPPCVNPAHLYEGTYKSNSEDMYARGRANPGQQLLYARLGSRPDVSLRLKGDRERKTGQITLDEEDWRWFRQELEAAAHEAIERFVARVQRGDLAQPDADVLVKIEDPEAQLLWWSEGRAA